MKKQLLNRLRNRSAAFVHDMAMVPLAWFGAYWLRFNLESIPAPFWQRALTLLPLVLLVHGVMFIHFGLYRGVWRFASMPDFVRILKAVMAAVVVFGVLAYAFTQLTLVPRSALILHGLLLFLLLGAPRFLYRWIKDHRLYRGPGTRVLIVGAGTTGEALTRDLLQDPEGVYQPVAFVDDDPRKIGKEVRGIPVVAPVAKIPKVVARYAVDLIFIAVPTASAEAMQHIVTHCEQSGRAFRTLPPRLHDLLSDHTILHELRNVCIEDLLGRAPVSLDWDTIRRKLTERTVLISGGGGSIGSELCRQVASFAPTAVIILERNEFNLYEIDRELRGRFPTLPLYCHLADICDKTTVNHWLRHYQPDLVFHAAAYKHVPLLENQAREAIRNNLFGTINLAEAANQYGCKTFVLISTDKAVHPISVMGASKQLAEMYCQNFNAHAHTRFVTVRFGNVLGSAGSVVPLFRQQIEAGGPVTVTHPDVCRYFMTIPEACQLIMQAGAVGEGGEIYVLDMGKPINIRFLAEQMILLSGKAPGKDIAIQFIGLRPGEKLSEELFYDREDLMPTPYSKLLLAQPQGVDWPRFGKALKVLRESCERYDEAMVRALISEWVPEFQAGDNDQIPYKIAHG